jgi:hypothetical protein
MINVYTFVSGISSGNEINRMEKSIISLRQENQELENKIYSLNSLEHAASAAASMNFINKSTPIYLESLKYARGRL